MTHENKKKKIKRREALQFSFFPLSCVGVFMPPLSKSLRTQAPPLPALSRKAGFSTTHKSTKRNSAFLFLPTPLVHIQLFSEQGSEKKALKVAFMCEKA